MSNEERLIKVLKSPYVSEKATRLEDRGQYVFKVALDANKFEIKNAVSYMFKVVVDSVQVSNVKSKSKTFARIKGKRKAWKKAYVCLKDGESIDFSNIEKKERRAK